MATAIAPAAARPAPPAPPAASPPPPSAPRAPRDVRGGRSRAAGGQLHPELVGLALERLDALAHLRVLVHEALAVGLRRFLELLEDALVLARARHRRFAGEGLHAPGARG